MRSKAWKQLDRMRNVDEIFTLICTGNYFAGGLDADIPIDESRRAFERIKKLLAKKS